MASSALASAPKSVRDEAHGLARRSAANATKRAQSGAAVAVAGIPVVSGVTLGVIERVTGVDPAMLGGIDNGVVLGAPIVALGALGMKGKWGFRVMLAGAGLLSSGGRAMAREFGAEGGTEGM